MSASQALLGQVIRNDRGAFGLLAFRIHNWIVASEPDLEPEFRRQYVDYGDPHRAEGFACPACAAERYRGRIKSKNARGRMVRMLRRDYPVALEAMLQQVAADLNEQEAR